MKTIILVLFLLSLFAISVSAHTIYRPSDAGRFIVEFYNGADEQPTIQADPWLTTQIIDNLKGDMPTTVLTIKHAPTVEYRTGKIHVHFKSTDYEIEVVQAGSLQIITEPGAIVTNQFRHADVRKVWFVPDTGETLPDPHAYPTRDGVMIDILPKPGYLYIETATGIYSARTTWP